MKIINNSLINGLTHIAKTYKMKHELTLLHGIEINGQSLKIYRLETPEVVYIDKIVISSNEVKLETMEFSPEKEIFNLELIEHE